MWLGTALVLPRSGVLGGRPRALTQTTSRPLTRVGGRIVGHFDAVTQTTPYEWLIENGVVGLEASDLKTFFADDGRHFKDKEAGNPLPLLSETRQMLSQPGLQEVGLLGPMEGIRYEPLASAGEVFSRIQQILAGPGASSYRIHSVVAAVPSADAIARVDLDRQRIDLNGHSTPVATLARIATRFFSRRPEGLDHFLATGERPPGSLGRTLA